MENLHVHAQRKKKYVVGNQISCLTKDLDKATIEMIRL